MIQKLKSVPPAYLVFFGFAVIAVLGSAVFFGFTSNDIPDEPVLLYLLSDYSGKTIIGPANIGDIKANSSYFFYYPNPSDNKNRDVQEMFVLIRLPSALGGERNDATAFRAYSALDPGSSCIIKYWPEPGRQRIEDPCKSPPYRAIDGISTSWLTGTFVGKPTTGALPQLDLMADDSGQLYVLTPTFAADKNGVIGYGRDVTLEQVQAGTDLLNQIQTGYDKRMATFHLPDGFPTGHVLYDIDKRDTYTWRANYLGPESNPDPMSMTYEFCDCHKTLDEFAKEQRGQTRYIWSVGDTYIYAQPNKVNFGNGETDHYKFAFYVDGFRVEFSTTMKFKEGMGVILENYFAGKTLEDLARV